MTSNPFKNLVKEVIQHAVNQGDTVTIPSRVYLKLLREVSDAPHNTQQLGLFNFIATEKEAKYRTRLYLTYLRIDIILRVIEQHEDRSEYCLLSEILSFSGTFSPLYNEIGISDSEIELNFLSQFTITEQDKPSLHQLASIDYATELFVNKYNYNPVTVRRVFLEVDFCVSGFPPPPSAGGS